MSRTRKTSAPLRILRHQACATLVAATGLVAGGCAGFLHEELPPCEPTYRLHFRYTKNILNADAFSSQVEEVHVALYDSEGRLALHKSETRPLTETNDWNMEIDADPGSYDILAWCEGPEPSGNPVSFIITGDSQGDLATASSATLPVQYDGNTAYISRDIRPLYHGLSTHVELSDREGDIDLPPVYLTKDTNRVSITLVNMGGQPIDPSAVVLTISGEGRTLDWRNTPSGGDGFLYRPWHAVALEADVRSDEELTGLLADFTTGRIMADREQTLSVRRTDTGEEILSIPMVEYLLLVRPNYQETYSAQDYLDRCSDYSMVFFLDADLNWLKSRVLINGWRVVPPQHGNL